jgi:hypothetical protein
MKPEAQAACVQGFADEQLRFSVLALDGPHDLRAYFLTENINHDQSPSGIASA